MQGTSAPEKLLLQAEDQGQGRTLVPSPAPALQPLPLTYHIDSRVFTKGWMALKKMSFAKYVKERTPLNFTDAL